LKNTLEKLTNKIEDIYFRILQKFNTKKFNLVYCTVDELPNYPNIYEQIYNGKVDGIIIKNFISDSEVAAFKDKYYKNPSKLLYQKAYGDVFGYVIHEAQDKDLKDYFDKVQQYEDELKEYIGFDFNARFKEVVSKISNGVTVSTITKDDNDTYLGSAVKFMYPNKGGLIEHVGLQFYDQFASLKDVESRIDKTGQLSFFSPLQYSEDGGALILFDLKFGKVPFKFDTYYDKKLLRYIKSRKCYYLKPGVGELLMFNGGHIWHRVEAIRGTKPRITIGGFTTYLLDRKTIGFWN